MRYKGFERRASGRVTPKLRLPFRWRVAFNHAAAGDGTDITSLRRIRIADCGLRIMVYEGREASQGNKMVAGFETYFRRK